MNSWSLWQVKLSSGEPRVPWFLTFVCLVIPKRYPITDPNSSTMSSGFEPASKLPKSQSNQTWSTRSWPELKGSKGSLSPRSEDGEGDDTRKVVLMSWLIRIWTWSMSTVLFCYSSFAWLVQPLNRDCARARLPLQEHKEVNNSPTSGLCCLPSLVSIQQGSLLFWKALIVIIITSLAVMSGSNWSSE